MDGIKVNFELVAIINKPEIINDTKMMKFSFIDLKKDTNKPIAEKIPTQLLVFSNNFGTLQKIKKKGYIIVNIIRVKNLLFLRISHKIAKRPIKIKNLYFNIQEKDGKWI